MALRGPWAYHTLSKFMATTKATRLGAVNTIMSNVGQAPVVNLTTGNPIVEMAELILDEITTAVQSEGWEVNTERYYPFMPDTDGHITIPENVISIDAPVGSRVQAVIRDNKLYDRVKHTYKFTGKQELDVTWLFDFEDLPEPFKNYITIRAANVFAGRSVGSQEAVRFGQQEEVIARSTLLEYDTQQADYSIFQTRDGSNVYGRFSSRPIDTLYRS